MFVGHAVSDHVLLYAGLYRHPIDAPYRRRCFAAQEANEVILRLNAGQKATDIVLSESVDLTKSDSPFVMVYDLNKKLIASSGSAYTNYPAGVLDYTDKAGQSKVTWQPDNERRFASVAIKFQNGYVVAAQSLRQTEDLIGLVAKLVLLAWLAGVIFAFSVFGIYRVIRKRIA